MLPPGASIRHGVRQLIETCRIARRASVEFRLPFALFDAGGRRTLQQQRSRDEMLARANTLHVFCGSMALRSFCDELVDAGIDTPYAFDEEDLVRVDREHDGMRLLAIMDVYEMAARGKELGWKRQWCPFRGPAEVLWHAAFEDDGGSEAVKEASLLIGQRIARFHSADLGGPKLAASR